MTVSNAGSLTGRAGGAQWRRFAGAVTINGTTDVPEAAITLPESGIRALLMCKVTSGSGTGVVTVTLYNSDFSALVDNVLGHHISEAMAAISAGGLAGDMMIVGENSDDGGTIIPAGDYVLSVVCSAAETGTFTWQLDVQIG